jgi:hypothetical protein
MRAETTFVDEMLMCLDIGRLTSDLRRDAGLRIDAIGGRNEGHTAVGQPFEHTPVSGKDKSVSHHVKTRDNIVDDPCFCETPSSEFDGRASRRTFQIPTDPLIKRRNVSETSAISPRSRS